MVTNEERRVAAARWADKWSARFEEQLEDKWRDLADRVQVGIDQLWLNELAFGPGKAFSDRVIKPAVEAWVDRYVQPLIAQATEEFRTTVQLNPDWTLGKPGVDPSAEGQLSIFDVATGMLAPGGVALGTGALIAAITTTTSWLIFTTVVIAWPLLIAGLAVGGVLSWLGVVSLAGLQSRLKARFEGTLRPQLREGLVGNGLKQGNQHIPSLLHQLQKQVQGIADKAREKLTEGA